MKRLANFFLKQGHLKAVLLITLFATLASLAITALTLYFLNYIHLVPSGVSSTFSLWMALIIPLIVTPIVSWMLVGFLFKIKTLEQEMRILATYDSLTGILNRKAFLDQAEFALSITKRDKKHCTIVVADVDFFKKINDQHGHSTGDKVLTMFGEIVRGILRDSDLAGRVGGEEFAFCLPFTDQQEAQVFTNRLHDVVRGAKLETSAGEIKITVSIGLVSCSADRDCSVATLIDLADTALYQAKNKGRNQTCISTSLPH